MKRLAPIAGLLIVFLSGCAWGGGRAGRADRFEAALGGAEPPEDFVVALTVLGDPSGAGGRSRPGLRAARYVVEADGVLRAAIGQGVTPSTFPPMTRTLDDGQIRDLWRLASAAAQQPGEVIANPDLFQGGPGSAVLYLSAGGTRRARAVSLGDPAIAGLADELARLAWIRTDGPR